MTLGQRVKSRREHLGWSVEELAGRLGVEADVVASTEAGEAWPSARVLLGMANVLGTTSTELLGLGDLLDSAGR